MGKRVNLAELAREEVPDDYAPTPAKSGRAPASAAVAEPTGQPTLEQAALPLADIASNPLNRRSNADLWGDDFDELVTTIREHGVLQPIVVCSAEAFLNHYPEQKPEVIGAAWVALIGNRRLLAARSADLAQVPVLVNDERVATMYEVMLIENSHRRDLGPLHEAEAMQQVLDGSVGGSRRELATRIGRSHAYVNQRLALLGLIPALRKAFEDGQLMLERARELGGLPVPEQESIAAAGPPYRRQARPGGNAVSTYRRSISASTPQKAAESIRRLFTPAELDELVQLLTDAEGSGGPGPNEGA